MKFSCNTKDSMLYVNNHRAYNVKRSKLSTNIFVCKVKEKKMSKKKILSRVDAQVSFLTAAIVLGVTVVNSTILYNITYNDMISSLEERVYAIYDVIEDVVDPSVFKSIKNEQDMQKETYITAKETLEYIKDVTGVMYLYTAIENDNKELIYSVDGLDEADPDFRAPGALIEEEIQAEMFQALDDEHVLPSTIKQTSWGNIFITYLPYHDRNGEVIGVVGIEFEADHQFHTYQSLIVIITSFSVFATLLAIFISKFAFKRISNPHYKDLANSDLATHLKNSNSYTIDMENINSRDKLDKYSIIVVDLNRLKYINDTLGHDVGDSFIVLVADSLQNNSTCNMVAYRIGGDEFAIICEDCTLTELQEYCEKCSDDVLKQNIIEEKLSISYGVAAYDSSLDNDLYETYKRADKLMYEQKRKFCSQNKL